MLSEFEIIVNTSGVTIICPYLYTPRFIPFDLKGRCKTCKSDNVEIDYIIQPEGLTIFCSRIKNEKFVPFDKSAEFNENDNKNAIIRIRSRSKSYNIPMRKESKKNVKINTEIPQIISDIPLPPTLSQEFESLLPISSITTNNTLEDENISDIPSLINSNNPALLPNVSLIAETPEDPSLLPTVSLALLSSSARTPSPERNVSPISFFSNL